MNKSRAKYLLNIHTNQINKELLRKHYLKECLKHHPDKNKESSLFIEIKEAYDYLLDDMDTISPLFYMNEEYTHTMFAILKQYIYQPFETHINSYNVYELNPTIDKLFNKEVYYMEAHDIYIPLWNHELLYEEKKIKIKIKPNIPDYVAIDIYNNIHIYLEIKTKHIGDKTEFKIGDKTISFIYDTTILETNELILHQQGIPMIKEKIFEHNELSNIIIHLT